MPSPFTFLLFFVCTLGAALSLCGMYLSPNDVDFFTAFAGAALVFLGGLLTVALTSIFTEH